MKKFKRTFHFIFNHPLSKKHPFRSLARLFWWQFQCNLYPTRLFVKPFIKKIKFYARKSLTGITGNIYTGLHEFNDMAFLLHFLRHQDTFFDIGANVGSYSLLASGACGSKTIAIEPIVSTFNILCKNVALNRLDTQISTINAAAGSSEGILFFTSDMDTSNHVLANDESTSSATKVPAITIDFLLADNLPNLIKIDVEGYETEVLNGMAETLNLQSLKAIIIELNGSAGRYGYDEEKIHDLLISKGFKSYNYDPFNRQLTFILKRTDWNTLYCRDLTFVEDRLVTAESITVMGEVI